MDLKGKMDRDVGIKSSSDEAIKAIKPQIKFSLPNHWSARILNRIEPSNSQLFKPKNQRHILLKDLHRFLERSDSVSIMLHFIFFLSLLRIICKLLSQTFTESAFL